jgi:hypothetical protein
MPILAVATAAVTRAGTPHWLRSHVPSDPSVSADALCSPLALLCDLPRSMHYPNRQFPGNVVQSLGCGQIAENKNKTRPAKTRRLTCISFRPECKVATGTQSCRHTTAAMRHNHDTATYHTLPETNQTHPDNRDSNITAAFVIPKNILPNEVSISTPAP